MWVIPQLWLVGESAEGVGKQRTSGDAGKHWSAAAKGRSDSGFAPCCHPVAIFGYCMGWVCMSLSKGQSWKMPSRVWSGPAWPCFAGAYRVEDAEAEAAVPRPPHAKS